MAADVDTLNIKIEASADKAVVALSLLQTSLAGAVAALRTLQNVVKDQTKAAAESTKETKKISENVREMGKAASSSSSGFKKLLKSIGRIAFYRAIRTAIKAVTSSLKEGLTNLYTYSQQFGTAFAPAVDNLRQHILLLKNSFATALRPALEALMPVIIQLVDWFSKLADFAAQVLSVLFGKTDENGRYTKAVLGDLQEANEEAKELKRSLLGFDEINRLDGDNGGKKEQTALSTQFVQADVSEKAKKIADWINGIDWARVASVAIPILEILGILKLANLPGIKQILQLLGKFAKSHPILTAIIALLAVAAAWGDKIAEKIAEVRTKVEEFFDKLSNTQSQFANSVARLIKGILSTVMDVVGTIFSLIYKLTHGDMQGALQDLVHLLAVIITGIVNFIIDCVNLILGLVSDLINGIVKLGVWMWNEGLQPILNTIVRFAWNNVIVPIQNGLADLLSGFLKMIQNTWNSIARFLNDKLNWVIEKLNSAIGWINDILGWNIPSIPLDVIPEISDEAIENIENTKFQPITEDVIPKIKQPDPIDLTIKGRLDATEVERKLNKLFGTLKQNISTASTAMTSVMTGQNVKNAAQVQFAQYASGGWVDAGTLMVAGEAGPEVVGNFNGRTGVMNDEQLAAALYNAVSAALANNPQGGDIYLDGEVIYRNTVKRNNNMVRSTGRSALLT